MIVGFFAITDGHRVQTTKVISEGNVLKMNYIVYTTSIQCTSGNAIAAELRVFVSPSSTILSDDTVAFVIAKAAIALDNDALLEACCLAAVPGNVSDSDYQDGIPHVLYPHIFAVGQAVNEMEWDGNKKVIEVVATEYVRDQVSQSTLQYASLFHLDCNSKLMITIQLLY